MSQVGDEVTEGRVAPEKSSGPGMVEQAVEGHHHHWSRNVTNGKNLCSLLFLR